MGLECRDWRIAGIQALASAPESLKSEHSKKSRLKNKMEGNRIKCQKDIDLWPLSTHVRTSTCSGSYSYMNKNVHHTLKCMILICNKKENKGDTVGEKVIYKQIFLYLSPFLTKSGYMLTLCFCATSMVSVFSYEL